MDPKDVFSNEMSDFPNISDSDLDALHAGRVPSDDCGVDGVAGFFADFAEAFPEPSTKHCEESHLAAMLGAASLVAEKGDPAAMPASKANGPETQASGLPKPRRSTMFDKLKAAPLFAKIGAVTAAFLIMFSGVAFAGVLPDPVQKATSDAAAMVGLDIPGGSDEAAEEAAEAAAEAAEAEAEAAEEAAEAEAEAAKEAAEAAEEAADAESEDADEADEAEDADEADEADDNDNDEADHDDADRDDDDRESTANRSSDSDDDDGDSEEVRDSEDDHDEDSQEPRESEDSEDSEDAED